MGDIEIQIRRSTKATENYNKKENISVKSSAVAHQNGNQEKKNTADEKPTTNQGYWDYSISHGKIK